MPGSWRVWLLMAGRGFGKTRCGAEWVRAEVKAGRRRIALVGRLRPMRAMSWLRAHPAFWPFRPPPDHHDQHQGEPEYRVIGDCRTHGRGLVVESAVNGPLAQANPSQKPDRTTPHPASFRRPASPPSRPPSVLDAPGCPA